MTRIRMDMDCCFAKGYALNQSLSVVLPVHNAEATLARQVVQLLDILPDLRRGSKSSIVDDGSTDHTHESAQDLAREYPQLKVVRHAERRGMPAVVQTGAEQATGDVVFVHDATLPVSPSNLRRLWATNPPRDASRPSGTHAEPGRRSARPADGLGFVDRSEKARRPNGRPSRRLADAPPEARAGPTMTSSRPPTRTRLPLTRC